MNYKVLNFPLYRRGAPRLYYIFYLFAFLPFLVFAQVDAEKIKQLHNDEFGSVYLSFKLSDFENNALGFSLQDLADNYSIDKFDAKNDYVRLWVPSMKYNDFISLDLPFDFFRESDPKVITMATTIEQMANWDRYPTYAVYLEMMNKFVTDYPTICKLDTILLSTPNNHQILALNINKTGSENPVAPAYWYSSSIHGDELLGYVLHLRFADYLLKNQENPKVKFILENVNIWITPLENPDGTFWTNNNTVGNYPTSRRENRNNQDLNRTYPYITFPTKTVLEPEIQAVINFVEKQRNLGNPITMSSMHHGGAELYNFPWDSYLSSQVKHPDHNWWNYIGRRFADTLHKFNSSYFNDYGGVTHGGDWYVIKGGKQDYLNFYQQCRDVTFEVSNNKCPGSETLNNYWNYSYRSMLNYVEEVIWGLHGTITDTITKEPIEALIFLESYDNQYSCVNTTKQKGKFHHPLKPGTYKATVSAEGYPSKTVDFTIANQETFWWHAELNNGTPPPTYFTITSNAITTNGEGTISPEGDIQVLENESQTFVIKANTPDEYSTFFIQKVMVNGFEIVIPNLYEMEYTFADVTENHTIDAYFTHIGIDENKNNKNFMVSPNPADTYIDIAIENENFAIPAEALIVDMRGRILQQIKLGNITQRIDISKLQAEYYFITIKANNNFTTKKFIKR